MLWSCTICYKVLKEEDCIAVAKCRHVFHESCLESGVKRCPQCKSKLSRTTGEIVLPTPTARENHSETELLRAMKLTAQSVGAGLLQGSALVKELKDQAEKTETCLVLREAEIMKLNTEKNKLKEENLKQKENEDHLKRYLAATHENLEAYRNNNAVYYNELVEMRRIQAAEIARSSNSYKCELEQAQRRITDLEQHMEGANKKIDKITRENFSLQHRLEKFARAVKSCANSSDSKFDEVIPFTHSEVMALKSVQELKKENVMTQRNIIEKLTKKIGKLNLSSTNDLPLRTGQEETSIEPVYENCSYNPMLEVGRQYQTEEHSDIQKLYPDISICMQPVVKKAAQEADIKLKLEKQETVNTSSESVNITPETVNAAPETVNTAPETVNNARKETQNTFIARSSAPTSVTNSPVPRLRSNSLPIKNRNQILPNTSSSSMASGSMITSPSIHPKTSPIPSPRRKLSIQTQQCDHNAVLSKLSVVVSTMPAIPATPVDTPSRLLLPSAPSASLASPILMPSAPPLHLL